MSSQDHIFNTEQIEILEKYQITKEELQLLAKKSSEALELSYSPYSKFRVGAVVLTTDGTYIKGANIENASYGGAICAERSAICTALNQCHKSFKAIGITTDMSMEIITPCGICRQFIREFGKDICIVMLNKIDMDQGFKFMIKSLEELLPFSFGPEQLN